MGYATIMEFDVDLDTHRKIIEAVGDDPIAGLIVHAATRPMAGSGASMSGSRRSSPIGSSASGSCPQWWLSTSPAARP